MSKRLLIVDDAVIMRMRIRDIARACGLGGRRRSDQRPGSGRQVSGAAPRSRDSRHRDAHDGRGGGAAGNPTTRSQEPASSWSSAVDQKEKLTECIRLGAIDFIVKPFDKASLCSVLDRLNRDASPPSTDNEAG